MKLIAFYAGSFDPPTHGHLDIISRGLALVDHLVIGIGAHASKQAIFDFETRAAMLTDEITPLAKEQDKSFEVRSFSGLVVDAARDAQARYILRGLRNGGDFEYESSMTTMNHIMRPDIETVFLAARPQFSFISSSLVRQIAAMGGDVSGFVSPPIMRALQARFQNK